MSVWELLLIFEIALVSVVCALVFVGWRRKARRIAQAHSPEHRLKIPNLWTEIERVQQGVSTQMMRMKDGNFIRLNVDDNSARVLVIPQFDAKESFTELASFPVRPSGKRRRQQQAAILDDLRRQIGHPESVSELRHKSQAFSPPE